MTENKKTYFEKSFFGNGFFEWQFPSKGHENFWKNAGYDEEKYWGGFSEEPFDVTTYKLPPWAIGPFTKYEGNPVFGPDPESWDCGRFGGGVHNGSVLKKDGKFYYVYRGEFPIGREINGFDYMCDIGTAISDDGIHFTRSGKLGALRCGGSEQYSFEDANVVYHNGLYYMFLNRWDWANHNNPTISGIYIAVSDDLLKWEKVGLAYPNAKRIHRNSCVLQNPHNEAVKINGKFVMYINDGLMGISDDLLHWESIELPYSWPGGEGCIAMTDYSKRDGNSILLFTGGHHTGHFYAAGEVHFNKVDVMKPLGWLPRPILQADANIPHEAGFSADGSKPVSDWRDTVFFTSIMLHEGEWRVYYGGSEYYTCLATAPCEREV